MSFPSAFLTPKAKPQAPKPTPQVSPQVSPVVAPVVAPTAVLGKLQITPDLSRPLRVVIGLDATVWLIIPTLEEGEQSYEKRFPSDVDLKLVASWPLPIEHDDDFVAVSVADALTVRAVLSEKQP